MTGIIIKTFLTISSIREYRRRKNSCDLMRVCADEEEDEKRDFLIYCVLVSKSRERKRELFNLDLEIVFLLY